MTSNEEQQFLNGLDKKLWTSAGKLRSTLDAAQYKHTVLGLVFLKYVSDSFDIRRNELIGQFKTPDHEYFLDSAGFDGGAEGDAYQAEINVELEERDYYLEANVFWVPPQARWEFLQNQNKVVITSEIWISPQGEVLTKTPDNEAEKRKSKRIRSVGQLIDNALEAIEHDNDKLKGVLHKRYTQLQIDQAKLGELIDLIATIPFDHASLDSKDILGHVYEYFLGQFALAEGKKGGQFYTPKSIVSLIVQMLQPFKGRVYDPAMGSGGFFVQSEHFIRAHEGRIDDLALDSLSAYRQSYINLNPDHPWNQIDTQDFLYNIGAWAKDREANYSGLTRAGLLMFGKLRPIKEAFPNYMLDYQERPEAKTEARWIDRFTLEELAGLLNRSTEGIRKDYLQPMIKDKRLRYRYPTSPNHPEQAYIANNKEASG